MPTGQLLIRCLTVSATAAIPVTTATGWISASKFIALALGECVELRRPVGDALGPPPDRNDKVAVEDLPAEAVLVERPAQNRFVDQPQVAQAERVAEELEPDRGVVELAAYPANGGRDDLIVVEGERQAVVVAAERVSRAANVVDIEPCEAELIGREVLDGASQPIDIDKRVVGDRDHARARVATRRAERVQLLDEHIAEARLLLEDPRRRVVESLVDPDETSEKRPVALVRLLASPGEEF